MTSDEWRVTSEELHPSPFTRLFRDVLACPFDKKSPLVAEGRSLSCPHCGRRFPIVYGFPSFVAEGFSLPQASEMKARDEQADAYDKMLGLKLLSLFEIPMTLSMLSANQQTSKPANLALEVGCGTGRFTQHLLNRAERVVAVDFSIESLKRCRSRLRRRQTSKPANQQTILLIHADANHLPLRSRLFDQVLSCQLLEHLPTEALRHAALSEMALCLKPNGTAVISAYHFSLWFKLFGHREGFHKGGIFFHRFSREELHFLLSEHFFVERIRPCLGYLLIARLRVKNA